MTFSAFEVSHPSCWSATGRTSAAFEASGLFLTRRLQQITKNEDAHPVRICQRVCRRRETRAKLEANMRCHGQIYGLATHPHHLQQ